MPTIRSFLAHPAFVLGGLSFLLTGFAFQRVGLVLDDTAFYVRHLPTIHEWAELLHLPGAFGEWFGHLQRPLSIALMRLDLILGDDGWAFAHWHQAFWYGLSVAMATLMFQEVLTLFRPLERGVGSLWLLGAGFAFHPIHVNPAAWLSARHDVVAGTFVFLSLLLSIRALRLEVSRFHYCGAFAFFLAVQAKEVAWAAPILVVLLSLGLQKQRIAVAVSYSCAFVARAILSWQTELGAEVASRPSPPWHPAAFDRWLNALGWNAQHAVWPSHSTLLPAAPHSNWLGWLALGLSVFVFIVCIKRLVNRKDSLPLFSFFFTAATLAPTWLIALKPIMATTVAERYLYLPLAGFLLLLWALSKPQYAKKIIAIALCVWAFLLPSAVQPWLQGPRAIAQRIFIENPTSLTARLGAFSLLNREGDLPAAIALAKAQPAIRPIAGEESEYYAFRAHVYALQKEWVAARIEARRAVEMSPNSGKRLQELGLVCWEAFLATADPITGYSQREWVEESKWALEAAVLAHPRAYISHLFLGRVYASFAEWDRAISSFELAIQWGGNTEEAILAAQDLKQAKNDRKRQL